MLIVWRTHESPALHPLGPKPAYHITSHDTYWVFISYVLHTIIMKKTQNETVKVIKKINKKNVQTIKTKVK